MNTDAERERSIARGYRAAEDDYRKCAAKMTNDRARDSWLERANRQAMYAEVHESAAELAEIIERQRLARAGDTDAAAA